MYVVCCRFECALNFRLKYFSLIVVIFSVIKFQPDKRMCSTVSGETKPPLPAMVFDTEDKKDKTDEESNGNEDVNRQNDDGGGDTDVLENTD